MRPHRQKSRRPSVQRQTVPKRQEPPHLSRYHSLNDLQPTVRALHQQPVATENKSNSFHEPSLPHNQSYQSLPSAIAAELSFSSSTSNNNSVSPTVRDLPAPIRRNQSLGALHHKIHPLKFNKGSFVNATTFSAPISPKYLDKLPPIHKNKNKKKRLPPLSNASYSSLTPRPFGINPYHDALLVNNRCNKICENQETDGSLTADHRSKYRSGSMTKSSKSKTIRARRRIKNNSSANQKKPGFKRNQSMPSLELDLSRLSINENTTKLHTHHGQYGHHQVNHLKLTFPEEMSAAPKSARPSMSTLNLNAEGIGSTNNMALQFDLAPKSIDHRSSYDITADGAFQQNGFTVSSSGMVIDDRDGERRYEVKASDFVEVSILGRGSSSVVYKSWDLHHQRFIALKCISAFEQDKRRQIMNELGLLTNNNCPEIVPFYGSYFDSGQIIFCLEYFDIGSLQELIEINGMIPEHITSYIMTPIIKAVDFLHSQKRIIYRDIKPSNILIHSNGTIKLSDFGIIHQCTRTQSKSDHHHSPSDDDDDDDDNRSLVEHDLFCNDVIGTTIYMSPQRLSGKQYSFLSDIWSIGLCIAQSLHPQFPLFINYSDSTNLIQQYVLSATQPIYTFFPEEVTISDLANDFMDRCLKNEEGQRWSAKQLLEHQFIADHQSVERTEFKSYIGDSRMGQIMGEKSKLELVSIKQSLSQLVLQNKMSQQGMEVAVEKIEGTACKESAY